MGGEGPAAGSAAQENHVELIARQETTRENGEEK